MRKVVFIIIIIAGWVAVDLYYPFKADISHPDPEELAWLDAAMWRSYYENRKAALFIQSASLMRNQFHFPLFRSYLASVYVAKAAFVFKAGSNRDDYNRALPWLHKYFAAVNDISTASFDVDSASKTELEWWIIRRDSTIRPEQWDTWLAATASVIYHKPATAFDEYALLRVQAMVLRDRKGAAITEDDWTTIRAILNDAWGSFAAACTAE